MNRAKGRNECSQRLPGGMRHSTRAGREIKRALRFDDHGQTCVADSPVLIHSMDCKGGYTLDACVEGRSWTCPSPIKAAAVLDALFTSRGRKQAIKQARKVASKRYCRIGLAINDYGSNVLTAEQN